MIAETPNIPDSEQRLDFHLSNWARWMRSGEMVAGYEHGAAGCVGGGYCGDFDDMVAAADRRSAAIMDAIVNDLPTAQSCAVHHIWVNSAYRFPRENLMEIYEIACQKILRAMNNKGLW